MPTPDVPPTDADRVTAPLATGAPFRPAALALLTLGLVALCAYLTLPLLPAVAWSVALAIIAWPAHDWVRRHVLVSNQNSGEGRRI